MRRVLIKQLRRSRIVASEMLLWCCLSSACLAERGFVFVQVQDAYRKTVPGVEVGINGFGGSQLTGADGKAKLALGSASRAGDWLTLSIFSSPRGRDLVMVSPWDNRVQVPSFEEKPENFVRLVLVDKKDRAALEDGTVVTALAERITKNNSSKRGPDRASEDAKGSLLAVANRYGLTPEDLDRAIRELG